MAKTKSKTGSGSPKKSGKKKAAKPAKKPELRAKETQEGSDRPAKKRPAAVKRHPLVEQTFFAKPGQVPIRWRLIDADGQTLGRLSTYIATALMGKDKPTYTRSVDMGDFIVVINAEKVALTGNKWKDKVYHHHTGYPGGVKTYSAEFIRSSHPERLIEKAVWRMLPHGHMGRHWFSKLKVYAGSQHPHQAQKPEPVQLSR